MNGKRIAVLTLCAILFIPALAMADAVEGSIQGFHCVTQGQVCPVGKEDPLAAVEQVFVLHVKGDDFYFLPNVDRAVLSRFINVMIKVEGKVHVFRTHDKSLRATNIYKRKNDRWIKVWASDRTDEIYRGIAGGGTIADG